MKCVLPKNKAFQKNFKTFFYNKLINQTSYKYVRSVIYPSLINKIR